MVTGEHRDGARRDAIVRIRRAEACHACEIRSACVNLGGQTRDLYLRVPNTLGALPGDHVELAFAEASVVKASIVIYLIPALAMIGGALGGATMAEGQRWATDLVAPSGAALGLALGLGITRSAGRWMGRRADYRPRMSAVVGRAPDSTP